MDAFLKPSAETDKTGAPLKLRTLTFYENVQKRLRPGGLVVFNLNPHADLNDDLATIKKGFKQTYVFRLAKSQGSVAVASMSAERLSPAALQKAAQEIDRRFNASFSFTKMTKNLER
jgi:spermidine synthase